MRFLSMCCGVKSILVVSVFMVLPLAGFADETDEIYALIEQDRLSDALKQTETLLRDAPEDPALLFAQAVIAEKNGSNREAIEIYKGLTLSNPELLEPFNNLAIHYARTGDYKAAITTLEQAMQSNPSIATAYRNLTAIYAQLASVAYRKALNSDTPLEPLELASLEKLDSLTSGSSQKPPILVASVQNYITESLGQNPSSEDDQPINEPADQTKEISAADSVESKPESETKSETKSEPERESAQQKVQAVVVESAPTAVEAPDPEEVEKAAKPIPEPAVIAAVTPTAEAKQVAEDIAAQKQALINHIKSWAEAWSDRDVDRYLSHYSERFKPRDNLTLEEWKKQRYGRLRWREFIIVKPSKYNISIEGSSATVDFSQYYKSERFEDTIQKTLKFVKEGDRWLITKELI